MANPWYATRERVKRVLDMAETARRNAEVDDAIDAATRNVDGLLKRVLWPECGTRRFDWPQRGAGNAYTLRLSGRRHSELASSSGLTITVDNGATTLTSGQYILKPDDGPPYTSIEINLGTSAAFGSATTWQNAIAVTTVAPGGFGYEIDTAPAGALAEALDASEAGVDVTDSSVIGVGSLLICESERMIVTGRSLLSTGQTLQTPMTADESNQSVAVTSGAGFAVDEIITLDSERMLIAAITGNTLTVERAYDGSTLAAHTGSTIYAPRTLTVERGAAGTTAASHLTATALTLWKPPGPATVLCVAYALNTLLQQRSGYARVSGSGDNQREFTGRGIKSLENDARQVLGRVLRHRAVR